MSREPTPAPAVNLVVALAPEARPLLEHFDPRPVTGTSPFPVFEGELGNGVVLRLVRSGPGKIAAAAATAHLHGRAGMPAHDAWLNVGIGGAADLELGAVRGASRIVDVATQRVSYPQVVFAAPCPRCEIRTVDEPVFDYPENAIVEMEAAGFHATASRFATAELVHAVKVISDNRDTSPETVTKARVVQLMGDALATVSAWVDALAALALEVAARNAPPAELEEFLDRWHFSTTRRRQLRELLRRWQLLAPGESALASLPRGLDDRRRAGAVMGALTAIVDERALESATR